MGKKLAIKGHPTRGKEVIELLKLMGGKNTEGYIGVDYDEIYTIEDGYIIQSYDWNDCLVFTLEEFLEKYPFKVGDKVTALFQSDKTATNGFCSMATVTIKSMSWSEDCETMVYDFEETEVVLCAEDIESVNDTDDNHAEPSKMKNVLAELLEHIKTTSKEELEKEFNELEEWSNVGPTIKEFMDFCDKVNKKPVYPKTFRECRAILNDMEGNISGYKASLLASLQDLLICRDAYWKIAGEEMSLGKPWKPNWDNLSTNHEFIKIDKGCFTYSSRVLVFPTKEMRDAFYENFKDLIEECKELL